MAPCLSLNYLAPPLRRAGETKETKSSLGETRKTKIASSVHKLTLIVGFLSLFHAAYSAAQHRTYLRLTEQEFTSLPVDILIQGILSMFVTLYGVLQIAGEFKEIRANVELEGKSWETLRNNQSFYMFNHHGMALSPDYTPPPRKASLEEVENLS